MTQGIANVSVGEQFEGFLLIKSAEKGVASNGKPFLTIIFRDRSGEIDASYGRSQRMMKRFLHLRVLCMFKGILDSLGVKLN